MPDLNACKFLVIDDDEALCKTISSVLIHEGSKAHYRLTGEAAIEFLESNPDVDVIALDIDLGRGINGIETLKQIKKRFHHVQIIMVTGEQGLNIGIDCMRNGAYDYTIKPFIKDVFLDKAKAAYAHKQILLKEEADYRKTKDQVVRDPLTGLYNRRYLDDYLTDFMKYGWKYRSGLCLLMLDIDHFKSFNDCYGHQTGDEVLKYVAHLIRSCLRDADIVARYGGEEFTVVLHDITLENGIKVADKIRSKVETSPLSSGNPEGVPLSITISIGVSELQKDEYYKDLIKRADRALYAAKESGRNKVMTE